jgi:hypothetical protein
MLGIGDNECERMGRVLLGARPVTVMKARPERIGRMLLSSWATDNSRQPANFSCVDHLETCRLLHPKDATALGT